MKNDINSLIRKLMNRDLYLQSLSGQYYNSKQDNTVVPGPILHQNTDQMSEKESAVFEQEHPEVVRFIQSLKQQIKDIMER